MSSHAVDRSLRLGGAGEVEGLDDLAQCLRIILTTPLGSDPFRPWFGSDLWRFVDWPVDAARARMIHEARRAAERCEPRVTVTSVAVEVVEGGAGLRVHVGFGRRETGSEDGTATVEIAT